jgi:hypothetical protein
MTPSPRCGSCSRDRTTSSTRWITSRDVPACTNDRAVNFKSCGSRRTIPRRKRRATWVTDEGFVKDRSLPRLCRSAGARGGLRRPWLRNWWGAAHHVTFPEHTYGLFLNQRDFERRSSATYSSSPRLPCTITICAPTPTSCGNARYPFATPRYEVQRLMVTVTCPGPCVDSLAERPKPRWEPSAVAPRVRRLRNLYGVDL